MYQELLNKEKKIAIVGLGYVGLPIALEFAKHFSVIGFDINKERVAMMQKNEDPSRELDSSAFLDKDIQFTDDINILGKAHFFVVAVPTPVDDYKVPDLKPLIGASNTLGKVLKKGDYIIYESTVYPGCTEEDCLPILENLSGLKLGNDFKLGYSPERINPGDRERTIDKILKIVSGSDDEACEEIAKVYGQIITAGIYKATTIKVAEAAKVIENTQRDINISLMNELAIIFDRMGINTKDVIEAAATKWNFIKLYPGLVGGHCIGIDPYYLIHKSHQLGYDPQVINSGRRINDGMPAFIAKRLVQILIQKGKSPQNAKVLVMGITFKENVSDIRNSKVADLVKELKQFSVNVDIIDPYASAHEVMEEYGLKIQDQPDENYDAVIVAVGHDEFKKMTMSDFKLLMNNQPILMDLKSLYKNNDEEITYWQL